MEDLQSCLVVWRGKKFVVEVNPSATLKELGDKLQELTNVDAATLRLLVPMEKSSKSLYPFSDEHSHLSLESSSVLKGKSIRMMGVPKDEVDEVLENAKADFRIAGFEEEEKRLKQRSANRSYSYPKLPQGNYIFCDFRTLSLPGIELNPPESKALELLHKLASDPGIVAIMNKHRWRVGILTELAPVGYVGVSPKCILGLNKNHGEEISLRLRTDDLKGFRKYESIKKTLCHELAHMVFSEHDSNFYALDSQLNKEAVSLDWTKSRGHTLSGEGHLHHYDEEFGSSTNVPSSRKLGGTVSVPPNACVASVNAAFERFANISTTFSGSSEELTGPDPDVCDSRNVSGPEPDDSEGDESMFLEPNNSGVGPIEPIFNGRTTIIESEVDDSEVSPNQPRSQNAVQLDKMDFISPTPSEIHQNDTRAEEMQTEPDSSESIQSIQNAETDPDDPELLVIQDPVSTFCSRLQSAVRSLKSEATPSETGKVLQTLIKIISNVIENPNDMKFKKLRKANALIQRNIISYKANLLFFAAAVDILMLIGFREDVIVDESGKGEAFFVLKRDDPGLLWLAKSSLETCIS